MSDYVESKRADSRARAIADFEKQVVAARGNLYGKFEAEDEAKARLAEVEKQREAERQRHLDADLQAVRSERRVQFFQAHPTAAESSFDAYWQRIKADEAASMREKQIERAKIALLRSGRY